MAEAMKIRAKMQGDSADIRVLINHPMETGQRKDPNTGKLIPRHFIKQVTATHNGKTVVDAHWSQAISKDPFFAFKVKGAKAGDKVTVSWLDDRGETSSIEATIAPAS